MCYNYKQNLGAKDLEKQFKRPMLDDTEYRQYYNADGFKDPKMPVLTFENKDFIELAECGFMPVICKTRKM